MPKDNPLESALDTPTTPSPSESGLDYKRHKLHRLWHFVRSSLVHLFASAPPETEIEEGRTARTGKALAGFLFSGSLAVTAGYVTNALQIAGVNSMTVTHFLLFFAWLTATAACWQWLKATRRLHTFRLTVISAVLLATIFVSIDRWVVGEKSSPKISNQELRLATANLIAQMRNYVVIKHLEENKQSDGYMQRMREAKTPEEEQKARDSFTNSRPVVTLNIEYSARFKSDAIFYRDEIRSRLPKMSPSRVTDHEYESPTNSIGLRYVIDDLEKLARSLPDTK